MNGIDYFFFLTTPIIYADNIGRVDFKKRMKKIEKVRDPKSIQLLVESTIWMFKSFYDVLFSFLEYIVLTELI